MMKLDYKYVTAFSSHICAVHVHLILSDNLNWKQGSLTIYMDTAA